MKRTTAVILAAFALTLGACTQKNNTNVTEEMTPAAAPAPAMAPESAAMTTPAAADTTMGGMQMDTTKK